MSIEPDSSKRDLDRTDELPILDVEAYEASLIEVQGGLSRTDSWRVDTLQDMDELAESLGQEQPRTPRPFGRESSSADAVTANVERILKRIAELEGEITAAHEANAALRKRQEDTQGERQRQAERIAALERENERLTEQQELAETFARRTEQQLRLEIQELTTELQNVQAARAQERVQEGRRHEELRERIEALVARESELLENASSLQAQRRETYALAEQRAEAIAALQAALSDEKASTALLARQLAVKLKDHDQLTLALEQRDFTLADMNADRERLSRQLEQEAAAHRTAQERLAAALQELAPLQETLRAREEAFAQTTREFDAARAELDALREASADAQARLAALQSAHAAVQEHTAEHEHEIESMRSALAAASAANTDLREQLSAAVLGGEQLGAERATLEQRLAESEQRVLELGGALERTQEELLALSEERETLRPALQQAQSLQSDLQRSREEFAQAERKLHDALLDAQERGALLEERTRELNAERTVSNSLVQKTDELEQVLVDRDRLVDELSSELQCVRNDHAAMMDQLEKARSRVKSLTQQIFSRDNQIAELQADLSIHMEALDAIRRDVNRIGLGDEAASSTQLERMLEPLDGDGLPILLNGKAFTIGRTAQNDIRIPSNSISRRHARLVVGPTGVIVEDLGSTNGCYVNGAPVKQHLMRDGDVLELGEMRYRLCTRLVNDNEVAKEPPPEAAV